MPNYAMYSTGHLQDFVSILVDLEAEGIIDPEFMRQRIFEIVEERTLEHRKLKIRVGMGKRKAKRMECPDCHSSLVYCKMTEAVHCTCGWSRRIIL